MLWCGGALLLTLSVIYLEFTLNQHGYNSILQLYVIPSGLGLVGLSFVFMNYYKKNKNNCLLLLHLFRGIQLVVTVLSQRCNSRMDSGEEKVESRVSSKTQPSQV